MALTANKGEWSELYALFKLLGDKSLYPGQENLEKIEGIVYPIIKVLRDESGGSFEYAINQDLIIISENEEEVIRVPVREFQEKAAHLLDEIKSNKGTFSIPEIESFMSQVHCGSIKASSSKKSDITIVIHDPKTNQMPTLGFSIKSQVGSASTLFNSGKGTNFIYKIEGAKLSDAEVSEINSIDKSNSKSKIKDRTKMITEKGGHLSFSNIESKTFFNNLTLIDSFLPKMLAELLLLYNSGGKPKFSGLVSALSTTNPFDYDMSNGHEYYLYKIKHFLTDVALGMTAEEVWNGKYDATGGYLIVKKDGDIVCYHIYNKNSFEDYLIDNTNLTNPSTTKFGFAEVYQENNDLFYKLNLQIKLK